MICFRSLNYFWLIPTWQGQRLIWFQLWFAFVLWTTFDWYQHRCFYLWWLVGCDLLSFFELLLIDTNTGNQWEEFGSVVICFRSLNYFWLIPTYQMANTPINSCDLLSFFELLLIDTNNKDFEAGGGTVVICFRSLNYFWLIPTFTPSNCLAVPLWFAFVLWTTFDWYQLLQLVDFAYKVVICFRSLNYFWLIPTKYL